ncbi:MAG: lysophospholipid acyltransferase family protein [candidate division NC10 bacterium]|nr:1-acyl-sn-glycerol-3-phosphate acyltransferase [candidate division NC10 bacterium]MCH7895294.1 1-acyl-sn-glycerol-3-phosphate acyltransferase [candidate division NC10 bacterium]MCZ6550209.1 lysophospholipid acyltransferase family protein [candidate division NC10 bacterium]
MGYRFLQIVLPLIMPIFRFRVVGREEIPTTEGVILAANHVSYVDPLFIGAAIVERQLHFIAKADLFRFPLFGALLRWLHVVPVRKGQGDYAAIRQSLRLLKKGEILVLFPEGTRGDGVTLQKAEEGIGLLAARSGCPVVPVYVEGTGKVLPRGKRIPRVHPVTIYFGHPLRLGGETPHRETRRGYRRLSEEIMKGIADLEAKTHSPRS